MPRGRPHLPCIHHNAQSACPVLEPDPFRSRGLGTTHRQSSKHTPQLQTFDIADTARKHTVLVVRQNFNPRLSTKLYSKCKSLFAQNCKGIAQVFTRSTLFIFPKCLSSLSLAILVYFTLNSNSVPRGWRSLCQHLEIETSSREKSEVEPA